MAPRTGATLAAVGGTNRGQRGIRVIKAGQRRTYRTPSKHPSGARPPLLPPETIPGHIAIIMDGNGRWAKERGLPRNAGHTAGEAAFFDVVEGALELGVRYISVYAFSTENWRRSPEEVRFLMGFNRQTIRRRRDDFHAMGVRVRWAGRRPRLWRSVIAELEEAERLTKRNDLLDLTICLNYGGRAEIADAAAKLAVDVAAGRVNPDKINERTFARYLDEPDLPDVDLLVRSSGEQRISNYLIWQTAYAEFVTLDTLWPDFDRRHLWYACELYAKRNRRFGGAIPNPVAPGTQPPG
ncbi:MAG: isoprenyl transferase [Dactylosporangium sp.]|nr:isoprenyl transferase [Dactylosporangium sp.]NNJ62004.1 isoprenyl transferase [Dactylosporangium sp.]